MAGSVGSGETVGKIWGKSNLHGFCTKDRHQMKVTGSTPPSPSSPVSESSGTLNADRCCVRASCCGHLGTGATSGLVVQPASLWLPWTFGASICGHWCNFFPTLSSQRPKYMKKRTFLTYITCTTLWSTASVRQSSEYSCARTPSAYCLKAGYSSVMPYWKYLIHLETILLW